VVRLERELAHDSRCRRAFDQAVRGHGGDSIARSHRHTITRPTRTADSDFGPRQALELKTGGATMTAEQLLDSVRHELLRRNPVSPALLKYEEDRAENVQSRIADAITAFAGSMAFVYVHVVWFALWVAIPLEKYPFGLLTMIVSLEAIFLSTFVMISQNRADARRQVFADQQYTMIQEEKKQNEQLLEQSRRIEELNKSILTLTQEVREALKKG
jgi:uncharacterized membrane protein